MVSVDENKMTDVQPDDSGMQAQIVEPSSAVGTIDALNLRIALEAGPRRWRAGIKRVLDTLQIGQPLEQALLANQSQLPKDLRSLFAAAMKLPEPTKFILDCVVIPRETNFLKWQLRIMIVYPLLMLSLTAGICALVCGVLYNLLSEGFSDFGLTGFDAALSYVEDQKAAIGAMFVIVVWSGIVWATVRWLGPSWAPSAVLGGLPLIGKPMRWGYLYELLIRYGLVYQQVPDSAGGAAIVAASLRESPLEIVAELTAKRIRSGVSLGNALAQSMLCDGLSAPAILSVDHATRLPEACVKVAENLKSSAESRCRVVSGILPFFVLILIGTMIWGTISGYLAILQSLIIMVTALA